MTPDDRVVVGRHPIGCSRRAVLLAASAFSALAMWCAAIDPRVAFYRFDDFRGMPFRVTRAMEIAATWFPWKMRSAILACDPAGHLHLVLRYRSPEEHDPSRFRPGMTGRPTIRFRSGYQFDVRTVLTSTGTLDSFASASLSSADIETLVTALSLRGTGRMTIWSNDLGVTIRATNRVDAIRALARQCAADPLDPEGAISS